VAGADAADADADLSAFLDDALADLADADA
jgi:hypothetical protein